MLSWHRKYGSPSWPRRRCTAKSPDVGCWMVQLDVSNVAKTLGIFLALFFGNHLFLGILHDFRGEQPSQNMMMDVFVKRIWSTCVLIMFPLTRGSYGLIGCPWCYDFLGTKLGFGSFTVDGILQNTAKIASKKSPKNNPTTTLPHFRPISLLWVWSFFSHLGLSIVQRHSRHKHFPCHAPGWRRLTVNKVPCYLWAWTSYKINMTNIIDGKRLHSCYLGLVTFSRSSWCPGHQPSASKWRLAMGILQRCTAMETYCSFIRYMPQATVEQNSAPPGDVTNKQSTIGSKTPHQ